jgi:tellurite resistance protein TehA-like permease
LNPRGVIPTGSKTKIVAYTSLTQDCIALSVFVFALLFIIILIDVILLINVETLLNTWGWLIDLLYGSGLTRNIQDALNIGRIFIIFSVIALVLGIVSVVYTYTRREAFAGRSH